ncbi:lytic murein transglycosylase [Roseovarius amoyensis]|uniref:lytic murein transglycosylase n=1 Tax=Roseovarius amoyensis TaxID=2211448 RepID=UPI003B8397EC
MMFRLLCLLAVLAILPATARAQDRAAVERQFQSWLEQTIWPRARGQGVSRQTFDAALGGVRLNWDLPELVPPGAPPTPKKQMQAEFGSPARYFAGRKLSDAAAHGKRMARKFAGALAAAEAATGVPARIILAIWGRESGYGRVAIRHDAFAVLATKGFMSTRPALFTDELIAALKIAEKGQAPAGRLKGSWAGALGQPQFLPSAYLRFARDGDGDGRADIWRSEADTIASIAAYLAHYGWIAGRDWGFEVKLPATVSCTLEGPDQGRSIREWAAMGITRVSGRPFPEHERAGQGFLMLPAGRHGPAFVVTPNFYVLKKYNESDLYALFVGHLGDRIRYGMGDFRGRWGKTGRLTRGDVAAIQRGLERRGHDVGGVDGLAGFKTRRSIGRWQKQAGQRETCYPEAGMAKALSR